MSKSIIWSYVPFQIDVTNPNDCINSSKEHRIIIESKDDYNLYAP